MVLVEMAIQFEDEYSETEQEEIKNKVIALPQQEQVLKPVLFWDTEKEWNDKQGNKRKGVFGQLRDPSHCLQLLDLALAAYDDYLLADVVETVLPAKMPQKSFNRQFALDIIANLSENVKLAIAQGVINEFIKSYSRKILFLKLDNEIVSVFCMRDNEKGFSADIEIAFRGTPEQRMKAIWWWKKKKDTILKDLFDIGYRRLYVETAVGENIIKFITRKEKPGVVQNIKLLRNGKFNNKVISYKQYLLNLGFKFSE